MERRSKRERKSVNYTCFATNSDEDSEDDFATPPPAKKPKERKQVSKTRPEGSGPTLTTAGSEEPSTTAARGRASPDEKQFNRDLQRVLEASRQTSSMQPEACVDLTEHDDDFCPDGGDSSSGSSSGTDSDFDPSSPLPQPKKGRAKAAKGGAAAKSGPQSSGRRAEVKAASVVKPPASKGTGQDKKTKIAPTPATKRSAIPSTTSPTPVKPEALGSPALSGNRPTPGLGVRRMPKWTPPAAAPANRGKGGPESARRAPSGTGSGGIRVGLSRTARVKPLHTRPTIPNT